MAANNLQEAGLLLTAQGAEEFKSAMKGISAATKEAYSELKLAQSQYDKNTSGTQKLADKQKYLQKMTEEYTKKEQVLKAQLEQMENAEERDEAAIAKKRAELNNCKASLNKYEESLKDVTNQIKGHSAQLKEWGDKLKNVGGKMQSLGGTLTKSVTAPIMGVGAASVVAWKEVDEGLDIVTKKTGATGEALEDMQNRTRNIAKTMPTDFATAGAAVGEVNTRFGLVGDELEDLSVKFIKFAELNDTDVSSSIDNVQAMMAAWGVETKDAGLMLDLLTKAGQDSGASVDTLSQQLMQNKTALDDMGFSLDASVDLLANCEKNGIDTSTMLGGLKKALQNSAKEGKSSADALSELQEKLVGAESDTEASQIAMELFGNKAGPAIADACRDGRLSLEDLGYAMEDLAGTTESTFDGIQDPLDQMTPSLNTLKDTGAQLVTDLGPAIVTVLGAISDGVSALNTWWSGLDEKQKAVILTLAGLLAALGPVLSIVGSVITTIGSLVTIMGAASAGGGVMAAVMGALTGPIGIAIAAIVAIIAVLVLLITHWDQVKGKVKETWEKITEYCTNLKNDVTKKWEEIKSNIKQKIEAIKADLQQKWNTIKSDAVNKITGMKNDIIGKMTELKSKITEKLTDIKSKFTEKFEEIKTKVKGVVEDIKGFFTNLKLKIPKPELPKLPHFSLEWGEKTILGQTVKYPSGLHVDWYAKAMSTPYMFTNPAIMQTPYGTIGAGEAGNELMYGHDALMRDISDATAANNETLIEAFINGVYNAIVAALNQADLKVVIGRREFGRIVREVTG